ncbi:MAG: hypothetical protein GC180_08305 [Bacteroidetes bacterium]|nr:hypothetical protein [Bacteroidota bacterium]
MKTRFAYFLTATLLSFNSFLAEAHWEERAFDKATIANSTMDINPYGTGTPLLLSNWLFPDLNDSAVTGTGNPDLQKVVNQSVVNTITAGFDESQTFTLAEYCEIEFKLSLTGYSLAGVATTINIDYSDSFKIKFDPLSGLVDFPKVSRNVLDDFLKVECRIFQVNYRTLSGGSLGTLLVDKSNNNLSALPDNLYLELSSEVNRIYDFDFVDFADPTNKNFTKYTDNTAVAYTPLDDASQATYIVLDAAHNCEGYFEFTWPGVVANGMDNYEVEWVYIDPSELVGTSPNFTVDISYKNNSTRVQVKGNSYRIPAIYPGGYVVARVRGVTDDFYYANTNLYKSVWSLPDEFTLTYNSSTPEFKYGSTVISSAKECIAHSEDFNWEHSIAFAEEGKRKQVISYYDGSLRNRQTTTLLSTENVPVSGEVIYDYLGRPAVQPLPGPVLDGLGLCYRASLNQASSTSLPYNWKDFDPDYNACGQTQTGHMSSSSGSAKYYSTNGSDGIFNASTSYEISTNQTNMAAFLPDAQGYPFSQVEYMPDGTGRVRRQGGVGPTHQLLGVDENVNALPGKEVAYYYGYPTQTELLRLFGNEVGIYQRYKKNYVVDQNGQWSVSYVDASGRTIATSLVSDPENSGNLGALSSGEIQADNLTENIANTEIRLDEGQLISVLEQVVTLDGDYSFNYSMTSPQLSGFCNNSLCFDCIYDFKLSIKDECGNELIPGGPKTTTIGTIDFDCGAEAITFSVTPAPLVIPVTKGMTLHIEKVLSVNQDAYLQYEAKFLENIDDCIQSYDELYTEERAKLSDDCDYDMCDDCAGDAATKLANGEINQNEYDYTLFQCQEVCNPTPCTILMRNMIQDMSPGGQYYDNLSPYEPGVTNPDDQIADHTFMDQLLTPQQHNDFFSAVNLERGTSYTSWDDIRNDFDDLEAFMLVQYHPEYCVYENCKLIEETYNFDYQMLTSDNAADALVNGYFNPIGSNTNTSLFPAPTVMDPFFVNSSGNPIGYYYEMREGLLKFDGSTWTSLWQILDAMQTSTPSVQNTVGSQSCPSSYDFQLFYSGYQTKKSEWIYKYYDSTSNTSTCTVSIDPTKTRRFVYDFNAQLTSNPLYDADRTVMKKNIEADMATDCHDRCEGYADVWMSSLAPCNLSPTHADMLKAELIEICANSCNTNQVAGGTSTNVPTLNNNRTFEEALAWIMNLGGYSYSADCNVDVIDMPNTTEQLAPVYTSKPLDQCACDKIAANTTEYQTMLSNSTLPAGICSESDYFTYKYGFSVNLDLAKCECAQLSNPGNLPIECDYYNGLFNIEARKRQEKQLIREFEMFINPMIANSGITWHSSGAPGYDLLGMFPVYFTSEWAFYDRTQYACSSLTYVSNLTQVYDPTYGYIDQVTIDFSNPCYSGCTMTIDFTDPSQAFSMANISSFQFTSYELDGGTLHVTVINPANQQEVDLSISGCLTGTTTDPEFPDIYIPSSFGCIPCVQCSDVQQYWSDFESKYSGITFDKTNTDHVQVFQNYVKNTKGKNLPMDDLQAMLENCYTLENCPPTRISHLLVSLFQDLLDNGNINDASTSLNNSTYGPAYAELFDFGFDGCNPRVERISATEYHLVNDCGFTCTLTLSGPIYGSMVLAANQSYSSSSLDHVLQIATDASFTSFLTITSDCFVFADCDPDPYLQICAPDPGTPVDPCVAFNDELAAANAYRRYSDLKEAALKNFKDQYYSKCMEAFEDFNMNYDIKEYHYTLYYYDQAGNLIKTVPPAGVNLITDQNDLDQAENYLLSQSGTRILPSHSLITGYKYNSINELVEQSTPDGGTSTFYYDYLGRLVVSQNAMQNQNQRYSYTKFDELGRVSEIGEITLPNGITPSESADPTFLATLLDNNKTSKTEIVTTYYDEAIIPITLIPDLDQDNLRNRVSTSTRQEVYSSDPLVYDYATHYSYDIHGNVTKLVTDRPSLETYGQRFKTMEYRYDLISGNTHIVMYQPGELDQWTHYYRYDADNRITHVHTSSNFDPDLLRGFTLPNLTANPYWRNDAENEYYLHGPLMRMSYGTPIVQAVDYSYTIHGWLKAMNSTALSPDYDMGKDGSSTGMQAANPKDVFAMQLQYYDGDYSYVNFSGANSVVSPIATQSSQSNLKLNTYDLYNGNIAQMHVSIPDPLQLDQGNFVNATLGKTYHYDQLNRILSSINHDDFDLGTFNWGTSIGTVSEQYKTLYTYDPNGNILSLFRNGVDGNLPMDDLTYHYISGTNQLEYVSEAQTDDYNYGDDIENQDPANYDYDEIGNLIQDQSEEIASIEWNVMGKIHRINRTVNSTKSDLEFVYDETGRRIEKIEYFKVLTGQLEARTVYALDPSGNTMAVYTHNIWLVGSTYYDSLYLGEHMIYGSSRVGLEKVNRNLAFRQYELDNGQVINESITIHLLDGDVANYSATEIRYALENERDYRGNKRYEISNHLGNVSAVVTDKKLAVTSPGTPTVPDYFMADVYMLYDYYPFGSMMPERFYINNGCVRVAQPPVTIELENDDFSTRINDPSQVGTWTSTDENTIHTSFNQSCQCFEINTYNNSGDYVATAITPAIGTKNTVTVRFDPDDVTKVTLQVVDPVTGKVWANRIFDYLVKGHEITAELEYTPDITANSPLELRIYAWGGSGYAGMLVKEVNWHDIGGTNFTTLMNETYTATTGGWTSGAGVLIGNGPGMDVVNITSTTSGTAWNPMPVTPGLLHRVQFDLSLYTEPQVEIEVYDPAATQVLYKQRVENNGAGGYHLDASFTPMGATLEFHINLIGATQPSGIDLDNFILETPTNGKATVYLEDYSSATTGSWWGSSGAVLTYDPGIGGMMIQAANDYDFAEDLATGASGGQEYYLSMEIYTDLNNVSQIDVLDVATMRPLSSRVIPVSNGHYLLTLSFNSLSGVFLQVSRVNATGVSTFRIDNIEVADYQHFLSSQGGLTMNTTTDYTEWTATGGNADFKTFLNTDYQMEIRDFNSSYVSRTFNVVMNQSTDLTFNLDRRGTVSGSVAVVVINPANNGTLASQMVSASGLTSVALNFTPSGSTVELRLYNPGDYALIDNVLLTYDRVVYHTICDNSKDYRYGFNGMEKDNERSGVGNTVSFKFRIHDTRLGRFLSVDPIAREYPWNSTYAFAENTPVACIDLEGKEKYIATEPDADGLVVITLVSDQTITQQQSAKMPLVSWDGGKTFTNDFRYTKLQFVFGSTYLDGQQLYRTKDENGNDIEPTQFNTGGNPESANGGGPNRPPAFSTHAYVNSDSRTRQVNEQYSATFGGFTFGEATDASESVTYEAGVGATGTFTYNMGSSAYPGQVWDISITDGSGNILLSMTGVNTGGAPITQDVSGILGVGIQTLTVNVTPSATSVTPSGSGAYATNYSFNLQINTTNVEPE